MRGLGLILASAMLAGVPGGVAAAPADVAASVSNTAARSADNVKLDESRKPAEVLQFLGLESAMQARLRQVDEHVVLQLRPHAQREASTPEPTAAPLVPAPRRVPVFLRGHDGHGGFGQLTITHPVVTPRRGPSPA